MYNVRRSTGALAMIKDTEVGFFNDEVASRCFSHVLGRCLRGRWFSIDDVESIILGAMQLFGAVFTETFGGGKERRKSQPFEDHYTDIGDAWRNSALPATANLFQWTIATSSGTKDSRARFMLWMQKGTSSLKSSRDHQEQR